jgi:hypothetical protein
MFDMTKHAAAVISARSIKKEWIEAVLSSPMLVQPDTDDAELEHRLAVIPDYDNRVLRLVVKQNTQPVLIITAYFDRTMKEKL